MCGGPLLEKVIEGISDVHPSIRLGAAKYLTSLLMMALKKEEERAVERERGKEEGCEKGKNAIILFCFFTRLMIRIIFLSHNIYFPPLQYLRNASTPSSTAYSEVCKIKISQ